MEHWDRAKAAMPAQPFPISVGTPRGALWAEIPQQTLTCPVEVERVGWQEQPAQGAPTIPRTAASTRGAGALPFIPRHCCFRQLCGVTQPSLFAVLNEAHVVKTLPRHSFPAWPFPKAWT